MSAIGLPLLSGSVPPEAVARKAEDTTKAHDAAQQFEALLIGQILRSAREGGDGWLGSGGDSASSCATDLAEQQLAKVLAERGGLGMADLITKGLRDA